MKHDPKDAKEEKSKTWGLVSEYQPVPLFDRKDDGCSFAKDLYVRRKKEIDECAAKAGFVKLTYSGHEKSNTVSFRKKVSVGV